jgi:AcrR family transcriptional regulator
VTATRARAGKGEETRARILESAMSLFLARGYEQTTMRAIAEDAGVAIGNAYYYFESKEQLIQAFYGRTHAEHLAACASILDAGGTLRDRLLAVMHAKLDTIEPYHQFSGALFRTAADPSSPLNPFSEESGPVRDEAIALFRTVVDGSTTRVPDDLRAELPRLLWTYHMGVTLYWIHDRSDGRAKTRRLVDRSVDLIAKLITLGGNPLLRPVRRSMLALIANEE